MNRPVLLRVEDFADPAGTLERCAREFGVQFAGVEYVLRDAPPPPSQEAGLRPATQRDGCDESCKIMAIAAGCHEVQLDPAVETVRNLLHIASATGAEVLNLALPGLATKNASENPLTLPFGLPPWSPSAPRGERGHEMDTKRESSGFARYQDALNFAYQLLRAARFEAEAAGVVVAVEAAHDGCLLSPVELRELIDAVNSWVVGACLDVDRVRTVGEPIDWLTTLTHRVKAVRSNVARDREHGSLESDDARIGPIWRWKTLDDIGFCGPVVIACESAQAVR